MITSLNILAPGEKTYYASNPLLLLTSGISEDNGTEVARPLKSDFLLEFGFQVKAGRPEATVPEISKLHLAICLLQHSFHTHK